MPQVVLTLTWESVAGFLAIVGAFWGSLVWIVNKTLENFKNSLLLALNKEYVSKDSCKDMREIEAERMRAIEERIP